MATTSEAIEKTNHLSDMVCMVTGASNGIGLVCATALANMGAELYLVCRNREKGERVKEDMIADSGNSRITLLHCDLSSLGEVRQLARRFLGYNRPLHLLLNNAAVFNMKRKINADKHEEMFAVNHLAHFLLSNMLLERIKQSAPARIVNVASDAHWFCKAINFEDLNFAEGFKGLRVYAHSKLANILFSRELAKRLSGSGVTVNAVHPGGFGVATGLGMQNGWKATLFSVLMRPLLSSAQKGASTPIYVCTSADLDGVTGRYFKYCREIQPKPWALDDKAAEQLWQISEKLTQYSE